MPQLQWNTVTNPNPNGEVYGPFPLDIPQPDTGEFSFAQYIPTTVSSLVKNTSRLLASTGSQAEPQAEASAPAWYNVFGRISQAASGVNDALQSTLIKIIILLVIASTAYLIFLSKVSKATS